MCGFAGELRFDGQPADLAAVEKMSERLRRLVCRRPMSVGDPWPMRRPLHSGDRFVFGQVGLLPTKSMNARRAGGMWRRLG